MKRRLRVERAQALRDNQVGHCHSKGPVAVLTFCVEWRCCELDCLGLEGWGGVQLKFYCVLGVQRHDEVLAMGGRANLPQIETGTDGCGV